MGSTNYPYLSTHFKAFTQLLGDLNGYLVYFENTATAINGTAALVVEVPAESITKKFFGNTLPASAVRAINQLPRLKTLTVESFSGGQRLKAICEGGVEVELSLPANWGKVLGLAGQLRSVAKQPPVEDLGIRKLSEFQNGWQFGEYQFLKPVIKPALEAVKILHPLAPRVTFVQADITLASDLVAPKPVPVLRLKVEGYGKVTALVVPATGS